jgi:superfamily II DNA helicase RecQ
MALSATCPPKVLEDVLKILRLPPITDGRAANVTGTVHFAAPLYRANLHYRVMSKPASAAAAIQAMADYINSHHPEESGIVYCLSKKVRHSRLHSMSLSLTACIRKGHRERRDWPVRERHPIRFASTLR